MRNAGISLRRAHKSATSPLTTALVEAPVAGRRSVLQIAGARATRAHLEARLAQQARREGRTVAELLPLSHDPTPPLPLFAPAGQSSRQHDSLSVSWVHRPDVVVLVVVLAASFTPDPGCLLTSRTFHDNISIHPSYGPPGSVPSHDIKPPPPQHPQFPAVTMCHYYTASHNLSTCSPTSCSPSRAS